MCIRDRFKGHKFIRININIKDEIDQFNKDVAISIDKWQPEPKAQTESIDDGDDLPF